MSEDSRVSKCPKCGGEIVAQQEYCPNCGELLDKDKGQSPLKLSEELKPGASRIGCFHVGCCIVGLIPLVVWLLIYCFGYVLIGGNLSFGGHLLFIIPGILYPVLLWWLITRITD